MARKLKVDEIQTELENQVKKLSLKQGDICVLSGPFTHQQIRSFCSIKDIPRVPVIVLSAGQSVEAIDEVQMKRLGWVRAAV